VGLKGVKGLEGVKGGKREWRMKRGGGIVADGRG